MGTTAEWTNKVELADLDGDGHLDILLANGGGYSSTGSAELSRVWRNLGNWSGGGPHCTEVTGTVLPGFSGRSRFIKAADVDNDGDLDLLTGGGYQSQLKLFTQAAGVWTDASAQLPQQASSAGDADIGDVDGDGDLDVVIADWGAGNPSTNAGGRTRLYRNNGSGAFTDETTVSMPDVLVRWSWDLDLVDVDNDWDLDVLVSCKACTGSHLFQNDGLGNFSNHSEVIPDFANNYDFEPVDIDNDGDLDLVTVNDGPNFTEHVLVNDGAGAFVDETSTRLVGTANPTNVDDNTAQWLDVDSDGDADLIFATLGSERLLVNDGSGVFTRDPVQATPDDTPATLGLAVGDIDGDSRPDLVHGQGEVMNEFEDKLQLASTMNALDTHGPRVVAGLRNMTMMGRVNAHRHDIAVVIARTGGEERPMTWVGGELWRGDLLTAASATFEICATDRAGNQTCATYEPPPPVQQDCLCDGNGGTQSDGGCCDIRRDPRGSLVLALLVAAALRRRSKDRRL
jgi:hypothetical protein